MYSFDLLFYVHNRHSEISGLTSICLLLIFDSWDVLYTHAILIQCQDLATLARSSVFSVFEDVLGCT